MNQTTSSMSTAPVTVRIYLATGFKSDVRLSLAGFLVILLLGYVLGSMAVAIPALWIASKIVRDRPFSSYSSARGGWNFKIFFICMLLALVFVAAPVTVRIYLATGFKSDVRLSLAGFLVILLLGPLQCIAEEYLFRGLFMQTLGSWVKIPIVAVIAQALVFGLSHTYNIAGILRAAHCQ